MKNLLAFVGMLGGILFSLSAFGQNINIPDAYFKYALVNTNCVDTSDNGTTSYSDADTNNDGEISVSEAEAVIEMTVAQNLIYSLQGIEYFTNLQVLTYGTNQLMSLDLHSLTNLRYLFCDNSGLTSLNVQGCTSLIAVSCRFNQLSSLNVANLSALNLLRCDNNLLNSINIAGCTNLKELYCNINQLSSLNVEGLSNIKILDCSENQLSSLSPQNLYSLRELSCSGNQISSLNFQNLTALEILWCSNNPLTFLNVEGLVNLRELHCENAQLTTLAIQSLTKLNKLGCYSNQLTALEVPNTVYLSQINCENNQISVLNVENLPYLSSLFCSNNQLVYLFLKQGTSYEFVDFDNNPTLAYICCDEAQISTIRSKANQYGYTNCSINSYCSFTPGGQYYTLRGQNKWDTNNNGCDATDPAYPNLKYTITNGTNAGVVISNTTGNYSIPLQAGIYTIAPALENPNYFTANPSIVILNLPQDTLNLTQNFCIIPNGTHHDVEVTIIPTIPARPGFDATYQITYKNKGNQVESDSITFTFQDDRMDFISASIAPNAQRTNVLQWNYTNLQPFETRIITVLLNINSPMETPDVNVGDILSFQAAIYPFVPDEALYDNTHNFRQIVVGSYDPNDKTCLEGKEILPTQVGDYLHYLIRFENTGTYAAENIVVKDMIDVNKFDISTLQLTRASHDCFTRINGNKVEFIFENINLPFTEPDKHGYVAFKIKTKPNLVLGDAVTNQADIFFDYNLPITTNVASTQVVSVIATNNAGQNDFAISLQPNPTTNYIQFTTTAALQKAELYDNLGRLVQTSGINNNQISIGSLASGVYFVKILAKEGVSVQKVVKE